MLTFSSIAPLTREKKNKIWRVDTPRRSPITLLLFKCLEWGGINWLHLQSYLANRYTFV